MWRFKKKLSIDEAFSTMEGGPDAIDKLFAEAVKQLGLVETMELFYEKCDFALAKQELSGFFQMMNAEAKWEGKSVIYKNEFVNGWKVFSSDPSATTARAWLTGAPEYSNVICSYIIHSCPGGRWHMHASLTRK